MKPRKLVDTYIGYLHIVTSQKTGTWTWFVAVSYLCIYGPRKQVQSWIRRSGHHLWFSPSWRVRAVFNYLSQLGTCI